MVRVPKQFEWQNCIWLVLFRIFFNYFSSSRNQRLGSNRLFNQLIKQLTLMLLISTWHFIFVIKRFSTTFQLSKSWLEFISIIPWKHPWSFFINKIWYWKCSPKINKFLNAFQYNFWYPQVVFYETAKHVVRNSFQNLIFTALFVIFMSSYVQNFLQFRRTPLDGIRNHIWIYAPSFCNFWKLLGKDSLRNAIHNEKALRNSNDYYDAAKFSAGK